MSSIINQPTLSDSTIPIEKKKRGRKKQNVALEINSAPIVEEAKPLPKKRGRKPKGGKIITQKLEENNNNNEIPNIIFCVDGSIVLCASIWTVELFLCASVMVASNSCPIPLVKSMRSPSFILST
mgnify:CR=1 FL=1